MNAVPWKEVVEALHEVGGILLTSKYTLLANRIEAHGIAPKPYVPMTDDEMNEVIAEWYEKDTTTLSLMQYVEQAVIKRAGLKIKGGEA